MRAAFGDRSGTFVMIDVTTGARWVHNPELAAGKLSPCSTFKIWNTLIGAETGLLTAPGQAIYRWDGVERFLPDWNKDLTLADALGQFNLGWFVGYTEGNGHARAFACMLKGGTASGKDARALVELLQEQNGYF
jgi:beta-lactamase class D